MKYRMRLIESPPGDPRPRYRGTGFCQDPGGLTEILDWPAKWSIGHWLKTLWSLSDG
jgi:hypothetical protein